MIHEVMRNIIGVMTIIGFVSIVNTIKSFIQLSHNDIHYSLMIVQSQMLDVWNIFLHLPTSGPWVNVGEYSIHLGILFFILNYSRYDTLGHPLPVARRVQQDVFSPGRTGNRGVRQSFRASWRMKYIIR